MILANIISVVSWITDTGVKDTPFLGSVWGAKEAEKRFLPGASSTLEIYVLASIIETQGVYPGLGRPEANSPTPACLD